MHKKYSYIRNAFSIFIWKFVSWKILHKLCLLNNVYNVHIVEKSWKYVCKFKYGGYIFINIQINPAKWDHLNICLIYCCIKSFLGQSILSITRNSGNRSFYNLFFFFFNGTSRASVSFSIKSYIYIYLSISL